MDLQRRQLCCFSRGSMPTVLEFCINCFRKKQGDPKVNNLSSLGFCVWYLYRFSTCSSGYIYCSGLIDVIHLEFEELTKFFFDWFIILNFRYLKLLTFVIYSSLEVWFLKFQMCYIQWDRVSKWFMAIYSLHYFFLSLIALIVLSSICTWFSMVHVVFQFKFDGELNW